MKKPAAMKLPTRKAVDPALADKFVSGAEPEVTAVKAPPPPPEPTKRLTVDLPQSIYRKFRQKSFDEDKTMKGIIHDLVEAYVSSD